MKAYIHTRYEGGRGFYADVVSEQDYHDGGYAARSHRTQVSRAETAAEAEGWARDWAAKHGYTIVPLDEVAA